MEARPITPLTLSLIDGTERRFILSIGDLNRLKTRFKMDQFKDFLALGELVICVPILYAALLDKGDMTEDALADLLPAHLEMLGRTVAKLLGVSFPEQKTPEGPSSPTPTVQ